MQCVLCTMGIKKRTKLPALTGVEIIVENRKAAKFCSIWQRGFCSSYWLLFELNFEKSWIPFYVGGRGCSLVLQIKVHKNNNIKKKLKED